MATTRSWIATTPSSRRRGGPIPHLAHARPRSALRRAPGAVRAPASTCSRASRVPAPRPSPAHGAARRRSRSRCSRRRAPLRPARSRPSRSGCARGSRAGSGTAGGRAASVNDSNAGVAASVRYGTGCAATGTSTADRMRSSSGSIVAGPREQFSPTTAAPCAARIAARLDVVRSVVGRIGLHAGEGHHGGQAELVADLEADERLAEVVVRLADDEVDAFLLRPAELLAVLRAHDRHPTASGRPGRSTRCCRCCRRRARRPRQRPRSRCGRPAGSAARARRRDRHRAASRGARSTSARP